MNKARIKTNAKITISPEYFNAKSVSVFRPYFTIILDFAPEFMAQRFFFSYRDN